MNAKLRGNASIMGGMPALSAFGFRRLSVDAEIGT